MLLYLLWPRYSFCWLKLKYHVIQLPRIQAQRGEEKGRALTSLRDVADRRQNPHQISTLSARQTCATNGCVCNPVRFTGDRGVGLWEREGWGPWWGRGWAPRGGLGWVMLVFSTRGLARFLAVPAAPPLAPPHGGAGWARGWFAFTARFRFPL